MLDQVRPRNLRDPSPLAEPVPRWLAAAYEFLHALAGVVLVSPAGGALVECHQVGRLRIRYLFP